MPVRYKIIALLVACSAVAVAVHWAAGRFVVQSRFEALELQQAAANVERVKEALNREIEAIARGCHDWAAWDDTYEYVQSHDPRYIRSTAPPSVFRTLNVNLVQFYDADGKLLWGETRDPATEEPIAIPGLPSAGFPADSPLVRHRSPTDRVAGLVRLGDEVLLVASYPVITSENRGPIRGAVLHGRLLSVREQRSLREQTKVGLSWTPCGSSELPPSARKIEGPSPEVAFDLTRRDWLQAYTVLRDLEGRPALRLKVNMPRNVALQGRQALATSVELALWASLLTTVLAWMAVRTLVDEPIRRLTGFVAALRQTGDLGARIEPQSADEIGVLAREFNRLVEQLAESRTALRDSEARLKAVVRDQTDLIYRFRPDGAVTFVNRAFCAYFGRGEEELLGRPWVPPLAEPDLGRRKALLEALSAERPVGQIEYRQVLPDGSTRWVHWTTRAVCGPDGKVREYQSVGRDVTDRKRFEEQLQRTTDAAEDANRIKGQFLANISHELRTPLHGILSFASFGLKKVDAGDRGELRDHFEKIVRSAQILLTLVNDLLELSKLESGRAVYDFRRIDLGALAANEADEFASLAHHRGIRIECVRREGDTTVVGDRMKLAQVLRNVLSNALKFSPDGSAIRVEVERDGERVRVRVLDSGVGISESELETVFDKFVQSSKTRSGAGGTGLRLAISREIVHGHRGRIWAANRPEGGAVLSFEIPVGPIVAASDIPPAAGPEQNRQLPPHAAPAPSETLRPEAEIAASVGELQAEVRHAAAGAAQRRATTTSLKNREE